MKKGESLIFASQLNSQNSGNSKAFGMVHQNKQLQKKNISVIKFRNLQNDMD